MTTLEFEIIVLAISLGAGLLGAMLGLGGGIIVIPALTLLLKIDIHEAIGASVVSVIATSSGAAARYVRHHLSNLRVAMFLEMGTTAGAITGAYLAGVIHTRWLFIIFACVLGYSVIAMWRKPAHDHAAETPDKLADRLQLHGAFRDPATQQVVTYKVSRTKLGLFLMYIAGAVSGLLGVGSGALKVPAMDLAMGIPIKVSAATSNFMIGVTAAASAGIYFARGMIVPYVAGPVAAGVLIGALVGSQLLLRLHGNVVKNVFMAVLLVVAGQMFWRGIH